MRCLVNPYNVAVSRIVSDILANDEPYVDFQNPGHTLLPTFPSFRPVGMVGEACLPSNTYYPLTPDYTLYSGVHVCWSEHSDSSFVYGFTRLIYGLGTMAITTYMKMQMLSMKFLYQFLPHEINLTVFGRGRCAINFTEVRSILILNC